MTSRTFEERFWAKVDCSGGPDSCWPWQGAVNNCGYGLAHFNGTHTSASNVAYQITNGSISSGMQVCHHCDNPQCCNPAHLFLGTAKENAIDAMRKGRLTGAPRKFTDEQRAEIQHLYSSSNLTLAAIADRCGASVTTIWRICITGTERPYRTRARLASSREAHQ